MRRASLILLCLATCQPEYRPPSAALSHPGLRTRLIALGEDLRVGRPLEFRLELKNESASTFIYDGQGVSRGSLEFKGPEGSPVPYIDRPRQTAGDDALLRPGETVVLFDGYDVAPYYLIARPGRYQVRFDGDGLSIIDAREVPLLAQLAAGNTNPSENPDHWFDETRRLSYSKIRVPSNTVTLDLKPGRPSEHVLFADRLLKIVPEGWDLGVDDLAKEGEIHILIQKLASLKGEEARVEVLLTDGKLEKLGERICTWGGRNVYASANPKAAQLWPDFRAKVAESLAP